jgi:hypothetical protein
VALMRRVPVACILVNVIAIRCRDLIVACRTVRRKNKPAGALLPLLVLPRPRPSEKSGVIDHQPVGVNR